MPDRIWLNGALIDLATAHIDPRDRGFLLGDGVFETIRTDPSGAPLHLGRHLARLAQGVSALRFSIPFNGAVLGDAVTQTAQGQPCALRLTVTRGPASRGVPPPAHPQPTVLITAAPLPAALPAARLIVSRETCRNERSPLSRIKSLNYGDAILARIEAEAAGADDALLVNTAGCLAEATSSNILLLVDGEWLTPPVHDGALPGIARALLLEGGLCREATLRREELGRCRSMLLVNSLGGRIAASIDGRALESAPAECVLAAAAPLWRTGAGCG